MSDDEGDVSMVAMAGGKALLGGMLVGAMLLLVNAGSLVAHGDDATPGAADGSQDRSMMSADDLHEAMHGMMDAMHGVGTTERMHEAMGPEGEELMARCAAMMGMMGDDMSGMMGGNMMGGMGGQHRMGTPSAPPEP